MSKQRYAGFWEDKSKLTKEGGILQSFLDAREKVGLPPYRSCAACRPDPPDFTAQTLNGAEVAIELTELVSEEAIGLNIAAGAARPAVYADWRPNELLSAIRDCVGKKDAKQWHGGPYAEKIIVIHTDEPVLSMQEHGPILASTSFPQPLQITTGFVLFSYDPRLGHCPLLQLSFA
jgi:hypothetical protein